MTCAKAHFVHGPDGGVAGRAAGGAGGAGGAAGGNRGTGGTGGAGGAVCQLTTQPSCSRQTSTNPCDPVCQSGTCPCGQKCTYAGTDAKAVCAGQGIYDESEACTVTNSGLSDQHDDCVAGDICLSPVSEAHAYCFRLCYEDSDCRSYGDCSARSLSPSGGSVSVCSPAHKPCGSSDSPCCNPLDSNSNPCPSSNPVCFLVPPEDGSPGHSRTVCEYSAGGIGDGTTHCTSSRDCMASLTCADEDHFCHPVCNTAQPVCPSSMKCKSWGIEYGYCIAN